MQDSLEQQESAVLSEDHCSATCSEDMSAGILRTSEREPPIASTLTEHFQGWQLRYVPRIRRHTRGNAVTSWKPIVMLIIANVYVGIALMRGSTSHV